MGSAPKKILWAVSCLFLVFTSPAYGQLGRGELCISVLDPDGRDLPSPAVLFSQASQFRQVAQTGAEIPCPFRSVPFGVYRLQIDRPGFASYSEIIELRSEIPIQRIVRLQLTPIQTEITVTDSATLLDTHRTGSMYYIGAEALRESASRAPGRAVLELVNTQPGWLLEANGVLHPRGSEYDTQYVIDGLPVTENRSPAFAPELDADEIQSMNVMTATYPAEYGRKLGGVIEVTTKADVRPGLHGKAVAGGGSFGSENGYISGQYGWGRNNAAVSLEGAHTERYLDPPVEENFTNRATHAGMSARWERDFSAKDRLQLSARRGATRFLVPNELVQEAARQRQDRNSEENSGQVAWTHVVSPRLLASIRGMVQDVSANLWSNPQSTPIQPGQQRGFRQGYANGSLSWHRGAHELKVGTDALFGSIDEAFSYRITNRRLFDRDTPRTFRFSGSAQDREQAAYLQDLYRIGNWTVSAGVRWDHYRLLVSDTAVSPRFGVSWFWPAAGIVFRASYDRAFQTPAIENLLLASSPAVAQLNDNALRLPVPPSRANFYQAGMAKAFWGKVRLEANYFRRNIRDFSDDDVLLNTGVSFPIAFASAQIAGAEAKLEIPAWGRFSGFLSYSNMTGFGRRPVTGGLFLGEESADLLRSRGQFPVSQDQRNSARARVRYALGPRVWTAAQAWYGSGLPVVENTDFNRVSGAYGPRILERVNLERGRVRPSFALDLSGGCELWKREKRSLRLQADLLNVTNRLNVINFAGLFSGTALAAPRSGTLRLQAEF